MGDNKNNQEVGNVEKFKRLFGDFKSYAAPFLFDFRRDQGLAILRSVLISFFPIWLRYFIFERTEQRGVDKPVTKETHWKRDLKLFWKTWSPHPIRLGIFHSVLGVPWKLPLQPLSEFRPSFRLILIEVPYLLVNDILGAALFVVSLVPVVCAIYPLLTWAGALRAMINSELIWRSQQHKRAASNPNLSGSISTSEAAEDTSLLTVRRRGSAGSTPAKRNKVQRWFFINGIMNSESVARATLRRIEELFDVDCFLLYNPTQGILTDLFECFLARDLQWPTVPAMLSHSKIKKTLLDQSVDEVLLFGHSQGCIISSDVLHLLQDDLERGDLTTEHLKKLQVYLFASPADNIPSLPGVHVELFSNRWDLVSAMGALAPSDVLPNAVPHGARSFLQNLNGHVLIEHHLRTDFPNNFQIHEVGGKNGSRRAPTDDETKSKLLEYL